MSHDGQATRRVVIGLMAIGALLSSLLAWMLYDSRVVVWDHAVETSGNLVTALTRDIRRTIQTYDLSLQATIRARLAPEFAQLTPTTRHQLLFDGAIEARHLGSVLLLDAQGNVSEDSSNVRRLANFAHCDYFRVHQAKSDVGLYISKPFFNEMTGEWAIVFSRRMVTPDGQFDGVVAGSINFTYFAELFSTLDLGPHGTISLFNLDGTVLYRLPYLASQIGQDFSKVSLFRQLNAGQTLPYRDISLVDGREKLFAFSIVTGLPLVLSINTAVDDIYADWNSKALAASLIAAVLLGVATFLVQTTRLQQSRRVRAERQTTRTSNMFQAYFENSPDALVVVNVAASGRLTYASLNPSFEVLTGMLRDQAIGKSPVELFGVDIGHSVEQRYRVCIESGRPYSYEETRTLPGGQRDFHAVLCPIKDEDGKVTLILGSGRDMTDENRRNAEHHQASKMEAVGRLTGGIAHDFNNCLQTITSSIETLADDYVTDVDGIELADIARMAAASGARLTHRLLAFSRQQVLQPRRTSVATLLSQTRQLSNAARSASNISCKIVVEPFTEDVLVDLGQAETCLLNLMINAQDAMPTGGDMVLHARSARPTDGVCGRLLPEKIVIIAVHDTGSGMDEETRAQAFEPFFTTKAFGRSSGLGLSMVQGFCRQSGGDVRILSGGAVGTQIELWLPAAPATALAGAEINCNIASLGRTTGRILLVEDEPDLSMALAASLVGGGFEVVAVDRSSDGLICLEDREPYDAILLNHSLSDMGGVDFLSCAAERMPNLPKLMLIGPDSDGAALGRAGPTVSVLPKPVAGAELLLAVRQAIADAAPRLAA